MSYENAPSTKLIAVYCACCSKELRDAISVEAGMGPSCRARHGYKASDKPADWDAVREHLDGLIPSEEIASWETARRGANVLVHRVAVEQTGEQVNAYTNAIHALGFTKLAARIIKRLSSLEITIDNDQYVLRAPMPDDQGLAALRSVPGRYWDKIAKRNRFPLCARDALLAALRRAYPGATVSGPKGLFLLAS